MRYVDESEAPLSGYGGVVREGRPRGEALLAIQFKLLAILIRCDPVAAAGVLAERAPYELPADVALGLSVG